MSIEATSTRLSVSENHPSTQLLGGHYFVKSKLDLTLALVSGTALGFLAGAITLILKQNSLEKHLFQHININNNAFLALAGLAGIIALFAVAEVCHRIYQAKFKEKRIGLTQADYQISLSYESQPSSDNNKIVATKAYLKLKKEHPHFIDLLKKKHTLTDDKIPDFLYQTMKNSGCYGSFSSISQKLLSKRELTTDFDASALLSEIDEVDIYCAQILHSTAYDLQDEYPLAHYYFRRSHCFKTQSKKLEDADSKVINEELSKSVSGQIEMHQKGAGGHTFTYICDVDSHNYGFFDTDGNHTGYFKFKSKTELVEAIQNRINYYKKRKTDAYSIFRIIPSTLDPIRILENKIKAAKSALKKASDSEKSSLASLISEEIYSNDGFSKALLIAYLEKTYPQLKSSPLQDDLEEDPTTLKKVIKNLILSKPPLKPKAPTGPRPIEPSLVLI